MGFNRNINQKVSGRRRQSVEASSTVPQKNIETMRILSNIKVPTTMTIENQTQLWENSTPQTQYFTDARFQSEWFPGCSGQQIEQELPQNATSTAERDIVDQALIAALNEGSQTKENINKDVMAQLSELNALIQPLSPWEDDKFTKPESFVSSEQKKKATKSKPRGPTEKEKSSKKPKLQDDTKNGKGSSELRGILEKKSTPSAIDRTVPSTSTATTVLSISADDQDVDINIFSQDSEMSIIKQVIALKKSLTNEKLEIDREYKTLDEEGRTIRSEMERFKTRLAEVNVSLSNVDKRRSIISKKLQLINEL